MSLHKTMQDKLLDAIAGKYTRKSETVDRLSDLLGVGKDGIYRRLRGETILTPDEIAVLAKHYKISIDALLGAADNVTFSFNAFSRPITSFDDYIEGVYKDLEMVTKVPNVEVFYATTEIPIFYACLFPEIISFKLYAWGHAVWDLEYIRNRPFEFSLLPPSALQTADLLIKLYCRLPSVEIWNTNIADNTLAQIEYHFNAGGFKNPHDAVRLCDKLLEMVRHLRAMAIAGHKFTAQTGPAAEGGKFDLYLNEMVHTNNTILVITPAGDIVYATFANPNFIKSTDERLCTFKKDWFRKVISKSNRITANSEKHRDWMFNKLCHKIEVVKKHILLELEEEAL